MRRRRHRRRRKRGGGGIAGAKKAAAGRQPACCGNGGSYRGVKWRSAAINGGSVKSAAWRRRKWRGVAALAKINGGSEESVKASLAVAGGWIISNSAQQSKLAAKRNGGESINQ
jgi:hypothetical protein